MTLAYAAERRLASDRREQLDYDDSPVPGQILGRVMTRLHLRAPEDRDLGLVLRWSYGPAFALVHGKLRSGIAEPWASVIFGAAVMGTTLSSFPLLGGTPPPWRWPADVVATSLRTHAAYVFTVAVADRTVGRLARGSST